MAIAYDDPVSFKTFILVFHESLQVPGMTHHILHRGTVLGWKRDMEGKLIGRSNPNPLIDTALYEVECEDGMLESYAVNQIAEAISSQVDDEGSQYILIDEIIDHRKLGDAL
jgi:hypothetical protein